MSTPDIIRAWKNEDYLATLSPSELSALPASPAGDIEAPETSKRETFVTLDKHQCSIVIECSHSNCA